MKEKYIAVYGSLRRGDYNYEAFKEGLDFVEETILEGFQLYSLGSYPCIVQGEGSVVVDIFKVTDPDVGRGITRMEVGAGYQIETRVINDKPCLLYTFSENPNTVLVENGDWIKYKKQ